MKKSILILLIAILTLPGYSQLLKFGIKAGAQTTSVPGYTALTSGNAAIDAAKSAEWGWHAGIFLRIKLLGLYIQPEAVFTSNKYGYNVKDVSGNPLGLLDQKFDLLSVPIMIGFKLGPLRLNVGPAANVQIGSPANLISGQNFQDLYKKATWGYQAGIGLDLFKKLTLDARYAGGFGKQLGSATIGTQKFNFTNAPGAVVLSIGYLF